MLNMIITGRICNDLEPRNTQSGKCVLSFNIASDSGWGENKKTVFISCTAWGKTAEIMGNTLSKGRKILIIGDYDVQEWEKDGVKHNKPQCIVREFEYMDSKKDQQNNDVKQFGSDIDEPIMF